MRVPSTLPSCQVDYKNKEYNAFVVYNAIIALERFWNLRKFVGWFRLIYNF